MKTITPEQAKRQLLENVEVRLCPVCACPVVLSAAKHNSVCAKRCGVFVYLDRPIQGDKGIEHFWDWFSREQWTAFRLWEAVKEAVG